MQTARLGETARLDGTWHAVDVLLDRLREARPLAVAVPELWKLIAGQPGEGSVLHQARDSLREHGYRIGEVQVDREGGKVWAWRLDYDKEKGR